MSIVQETEAPIQKTDRLHVDKLQSVKKDMAFKNVVFEYLAIFSIY